MEVRYQCLMGLDKALKILLNDIFIGISTKNAYLKVKKNTFKSIFLTFNVTHIMTIYELIYEGLSYK